MNLAKKGPGMLLKGDVNDWNKKTRVTTRTIERPSSREEIGIALIMVLERSIACLD